MIEASVGLLKNEPIVNPKEDPQNPAATIIKYNIKNLATDQLFRLIIQQFININITGNNIVKGRSINDLDKKYAQVLYSLLPYYFKNTYL